MQTSFVGPETLAEYFHSIVRPFNETHRIQNYADRLEKLSAICIILFFFSIFPLIPATLSRAIPSITGTSVAKVLGYQVPLDSMWFWWPASVVVLGLLLAVFGSLDRRREEQRKKACLSYPQMQFAYCYAIVNELQKYRKNRLQHHIQRSLSCWHSLEVSLRTMLDPFESPPKGKLILGFDDEPFQRLHVRPLDLSQVERLK